MRILIIDDEKRIRSSLINVLKIHYPKAIVVAEAENIQIAFEAIQKHKPEVVLLDIKMPNGSGFDLLKQIYPITFKIVFITAFNEFALQAIKFSALDYLLKPVIPKELIEALDRAERQLNTEEMIEKFNVFINNIENVNRETKKIVLNSHHKIHVINLNEIVRCEADRNYTMFYLTNKRSVLVSRSLKEYDEMLSPMGFYRPHHSHLINLSFVDSLEKRDGGILILKDGSEVPVSSKRQCDIIAALNKI
ncbi:MAG: response regulator transcription factor [Bacteroidia bacterium]|nr:response regulator transcription factor [Bacteroidia bacterium]